MQSSNVWIVTSTINTPLGLISPDMRYQQTIQTLASIRNHDKHSKIFLVDNSTIALKDHQQQTLRDCANFCYHIGNRSICSTFNQQGIKGAGESYMILLALDALQNSGIAASRIFKISGRYQLSTTFTLNRYHLQQSKFCFKKMEQTAWGTNFLHTRMWSACGSLFTEMKQLVRNSMQEMLSNNITIEEAMALHIDLTSLVQFDKIHCEGFIAPWNQLIED